MGCVLGVDVGGTKVAVAPVDRSGALLTPPLVERSDPSSTNAFLSALEATLRRALTDDKQSKPAALGVACAGTVDSVRGMVVASPNLPLVEAPLAPFLEEALGLPVFLQNDTNAALWAECHSGAAVGLDHVVMLTLGTGVGGTLLLDGCIYQGVGGGAGELGHTSVLAGGLPCRCGTRGCLEMYASGKALVRYASGRAGERGMDRDGALLALRDQGKLTGGAVARLALQGHQGALDAIHQLASWLGIGMVNISNSFNPEMIVVGGGVGEVGEPLLGPAREYLHKNAMAPGRSQVRVVSAKLGNRAGIAGVGLMAWEWAEKSGRPPRQARPGKRAAT